MKYNYEVNVLEFKEVHEIPDGWTNEDFLGLLNHIEYEDVDAISPEELKEMTAMALSDLDFDEAIVETLEYRFGDQLNKGQRQNLVEEIQGDRIWEEYADIRHHEELFNVCCMLYWAFPKKMAEPDIVKIRLKVIAQNSPSIVNLKSANASFIARLLNDGMDEHNIILRLFDDQIASNEFNESESIIWKFESTPFSENENAIDLTIYTSWNWVDELRGVKSYESKAFADGQLH